MSVRVGPRAVWRLIGVPAVLLVLYLILYPISVALSAGHGFGSAGDIGPAYAVIVATAGLRILLLTLAPALLAYRAVMWGLTTFARV